MSVTWEEEGGGMCVHVINHILVCFSFHCGEVSGCLLRSIYFRLMSHTARVSQAKQSARLTLHVVSLFIT